MSESERADRVERVKARLRSVQIQLEVATERAQEARELIAHWEEELAKVAPPAGEVTPAEGATP